MSHGMVVGSGDVGYKDGCVHARGGRSSWTGSPGSGDLWEMSHSLVVLGGRIWEPRGIA